MSIKLSIKHSKNILIASRLIINILEPKVGAIAVLVKTPGLSPIKTRLAATLGFTSTQKLYELALHATCDLLKTLQQNIHIDCYWAVAEIAGCASERWKAFPVIAQKSGGLGRRLGYLYASLLKHYDYVMLMGADSPHIPITLLEEACFAQSQTHIDFLLGPAKDGGFYLFGGRKTLDISIWESIPYSQVTTCERLHQQLRTITSAIQILPSMFDLDTQSDCQQLKAYTHPHLLPSQTAFIEWVTAHVS